MEELCSKFIKKHKNDSRYFFPIHNELTLIGECFVYENLFLSIDFQKYSQFVLYATIVDFRKRFRGGCTLRSLKSFQADLL